MAGFIERRVLPRISPGSAITASLLLMVLVIGAMVAYFARLQDQEQIVSEQKIVSSAIHDAMAKLGDALRPNTYWDDAYNHLTDSVNADWAEKNLGPYARDTSGVSALFVVSDRGNILYRFLGTEPDQTAAHYEKDTAVKRLVADALAATTAPPKISTGFVRVGDRIYLGAASQIVPNDDRAKQPLARHNVEIYLQSFDAARISKVQRDFQLSQVSLTIGAPADGMASVILRDAAGQNIGYLSWRAATPGRTFAISTSPFAFLVVVVIGMLLWLALRSWASTLAHLEKQRAEAETLRQESQAKSAFIGNISHELRTPLNAILGFSDIFMKQAFGPLGSPSYCEFAEHIHTSGECLLHRINDVIELSSIEAHEKLLTVEPVNAIFLVEEAVETVKQCASQKNVRLKFSHSTGSQMVTTSVTALHEILARLLDNAIKFSHPDGEVEVCLEQDDGVIIQVCDHGIGIDRKKIDTLGKPFAQLENHLRRDHGGLGLGLAIVYGLAKELDILVSIESNTGQGTTVFLRIPQAQADGLPAAA